MTHRDNGEMEGILEEEGHVDGDEVPDPRRAEVRHRDGQHRHGGQNLQPGDGRTGAEMTYQGEPNHCISL